MEVGLDAPVGFAELYWVAEGNGEPPLPPLPLLGPIGSSDKVKVITGNGEPPVSEDDGMPEGPAPFSVLGEVLARGPPGLLDSGHGLDEGEPDCPPWPPAENGDHGPLDGEPDGPAPFGLPEVWEGEDGLVAWGPDSPSSQEVVGFPADAGQGPADGEPD